MPFLAPGKDLSMLYFTQPRNFETNVDDNLVIGYFNGKSIVRNAYGELFYILCEEAHAPEGTVIPSNEISPITFLPKDEQDAIINIFKK